MLGKAQIETKIKELEEALAEAMDNLSDDAVGPDGFVDDFHPEYEEIESCLDELSFWRGELGKEEA